MIRQLILKVIFSTFLLLTSNFLLLTSNDLFAQNVYELRKLTEDEWLAMSTEERMNALGKSLTHAENQTFVGDFGRHYDLYNKWGYQFYEMEDRYENYAFRGFESYNIIEELRRRWSYNEFGDRIAKMRHSATVWKENYFGDGTFHVTMPFNYINSMGGQTNYIDGVWLAKESTNDWNISVIGAGAMRTKFTPLTLSLPNLNGMRIDFQSANNSLSIVNSSMLGSKFMNTNPLNSDLYKKGGILLRGGRFRRKFGVLTLGATYVNQYGVQGSREGGDRWTGTVSDVTPTPLIVALRFLDDSPEDGEGGPIISEVRLKVNGRYRDEIQPLIILDDVTRDRVTAITDKLERAYIDPLSSVSVGKPEFDFHKVDERVPKYADYFYYSDLMRGTNITNAGNKYSKELANLYYKTVSQGNKPIQVNGTETATYMFDITSITEKVNRVEAVVIVANDYRIQSTMIFTLNTDGGHDKTGQNSIWYDASYWRTMAQADGNVKDGSNVRTLKIDFGFQVASIVYGFDADFNYRGLKIVGEYITNSTHYMFPDGDAGDGMPEFFASGLVPRTGHRWSQIDNAYYITTQNDWAKFGFAGEIFKMGKFYRPYLDYHFPIAQVRGKSPNAINSRNLTTRLPLIEDNDDDDMYPDTLVEARTMGYRIFTNEDPDGVFPGNDIDHDGIADNNMNNNRIPDYDEPFLMFDVDRDEFVFGNDYNNNNIPDFREDDMKLDTPYHLDRQGYHYFLRYSPQSSVNFIAGSFRTRGVGLDIRTYDDYFKLQINYDVFGIGKLYAEYRYEEIQDNFRDAFVQVTTSMRGDYLSPGITASTGRFHRDLFFDELEYKNSHVNRLWINSKIRAVSSIIIENSIKLENNKQIEGVMFDKTYQPADGINLLAMVNKIIYTKRIGNWTFSPGIKFRLYKKARTESLQPLDHYFTRIPLFMIKYNISSQTDIQFGFQGLPGLEFKYKDYIQSQNNYKQKTYLIQLQNRTMYWGYDIWAATGIKFDQLMYDKVYRKIEEYKTSSLFVSVNLGW